MSKSPELYEYVYTFTIPRELNLAADTTAALAVSEAFNLVVGERPSNMHVTRGPASEEGSERWQAFLIDANEPMTPEEEERLLAAREWMRQNAPTPDDAFQAAAPTLDAARRKLLEEETK